MSQKDSDYTFRVVLVGDPTVGKTSIILRFVDSHFSGENITTNGVNSKSRIIQFGKKTVKIVITDTAGQERFRTISRSIYREADAVIVAYDQTVEKTFASTKFWLNEVEKYANEKTKKILVGNKYDLNPPAIRVQPADGKRFADELRLPFFEVSARDDVNIDLLFQTLVQSVGERENPSEDWGKFRITKTSSSSGSNKLPKREGKFSGVCTIQ